MLLTRALLKGEEFSPQQLKQVNDELTRLSQFMKFFKFCKEHKTKIDGKPAAEKVKETG